MLAKCRWISSRRSAFFFIAAVRAVFSAIGVFMSSVLFAVWEATSEEIASTRFAAIRRAAAWWLTTSWKAEWIHR